MEFTAKAQLLLVVTAWVQAQYAQWAPAYNERWADDPGYLQLHELKLQVLRQIISMRRDVKQLDATNDPTIAMFDELSVLLQTLGDKLEEKSYIILQKFLKPKGEAYFTANCEQIGSPINLVLGQKPEINELKQIGEFIKTAA